MQLYGQNPWFGNQAIQQQLGVNSQQANQLSQAYQNAYSQFQRQLSGGNTQMGNAPGASDNNGTNPNAANGNGNLRGRGNAQGNGAAAGNRGGDRAPSDLNPRSNSTGQSRGTDRSANQAGTSAPQNNQQSNAANVDAGATDNTAGGATRRPITGFNADGSSMSGNTNTTTSTASGTPSASSGNTGPAGTGNRDFNVQQTSGSSLAGRAGALQAQQAFTTSFNRMADSILTDPQQRTRFMQLQSQFRGFDNLSDPAVQQQLNMTDQQVQQITRAREEWLGQMNQLSNLPPEQRNVALQRFNLLRQRYFDQINQTLTTPEQRRAWQQMFGDPYEFGYDAYFGGDTSRGVQTQPLGTPSNPSSLEIGAEAGETTSSLRGAGSANSPLGAGSNIGTSANPTPGSDVGTGGNTGTNIGTGTNR
jgi:hypothetical protein